MPITSLVILMDTEKQKKFNIYFFSFFLYCLIGWVYEVLLEYFKFHHGFVNRGFLYGPYLPVYGFGAILILFLLKDFAYKKRYIKKFNVSPILSFIIIFFVSTIVEYLTGYVLRQFGIKLWDYSNYKYNFDSLICLSASIRFAIGGTFFLYALQPLFTKFIKKVPLKTQNIFTVIIFIILVTDLILTLKMRVFGGAL